MDFVSVERVVELLHLEQEPQGDIDPPAWWPSYTGDVVCENLTIRYAPQLDPSLSDVSFRIPGGSTTALLGRTGILSSHNVHKGPLSSSRVREKHFGACVVGDEYVSPTISMRR
jgi:hypothetical protein